MILPSLWHLSLGDLLWKRFWNGRGLHPPPRAALAANESFFRVNLAAKKVTWQCVKTLYRYWSIPTSANRDTKDIPHSLEISASCRWSSPRPVRSPSFSQTCVFHTDSTHNNLPLAPRPRWKDNKGMGLSFAHSSRARTSKSSLGKFENKITRLTNLWSPSMPLNGPPAYRAGSPIPADWTGSSAWRS